MVPSLKAWAHLVTFQVRSMAQIRSKYAFWPHRQYLNSKIFPSTGSYDFILYVSGPDITIKDRQNDIYSCHGLAGSVLVR